MNNDQAIDHTRVDDARVSSQAKRVTKLDSLRGLAALSVVIYHTSLSLPDSLTFFVTDRLWFLWPFAATIDGNDAVRLFFLLSGYVLSLSYFGRTAPSYFDFAIRRACRIYIPYAVVLTVTALLYGQLPDNWSQPVGNWLLAVFHTTGLNDLVKSFLMLRTESATNPPMWSLVIEMRVSLLFPVLMYLVKRFGCFQILAASIVLWAASQLLSHLKLSAAGEELRVTTLQLMLFVFGVVFAQNRIAIARYYHSLGTFATTCVWLLGLALIEYRYVPIALPMQPIVPMFGVIVLFPLFLASGRVDRPLDAPAVRFLGKVSYSLYLCHFPILIALTHLPFGALPSWVVICLDIPVSIAVAAILYELVEAPAARLGHRLTNRTRQNAPSPSALPLN